MFFVVSKIFWMLAQPLNAICLLAVAGLAVGLKWPGLGRKFVKTAVLLLLVFGVFPLGPLMVTWLERQYPPLSAIPEPIKIDGIIVLGGTFDSALSAARGRIAANDQIERMFCFVELAKVHPEARLVYSGGAGDILNPDAMEGNDARAFFDLIGFDRDVIYEEKSRNTYQNVFYSKEMLEPQENENWVVVTSAYHMPRATGVFEKQEWGVIPYSCDHKTDGTYSGVWRRLPNVTANFHMLNLALRELIGSTAYYVTGKSAFILP